MLSGDREVGRETRRVTFAFVVLVLASFLLLNVGIYHGARSRLIAERWDQLASSSEEKRKDVRQVLREVEKEAEFVAGQDEFRLWVADPAAAAKADPLRALELERRLDHAAASFDLDAIEIMSPDGRVLANTTQADLWRTPSSAALTSRVLASAATGLQAEYSESSGKPMVLVAAPIRSPQGEGVIGVVLVHAGLDERFRRSLTEWVISGSGAGAFLTLRRGDEVMIVTQPPPGAGLYLGQRLALQDPAARAVAGAALGVESQVELPGRPPDVVWAVTRSIPELGCGLVGQARRATMLAGMRATLLGLLVLDIGVAFLAVLLMFSWRRQIHARMAEREVSLTRQHAERVQAVVDSAFEAILSLDAGRRVLTANRAAERLFQRGADQMVAQPLERFVRRDADLRLDITEAGEPGRVSRSEALRSNGSTVPVEYSLACSGTGENALYTFVARDVSARIEAEQQIQLFAEGLAHSNRRLEEANAQLEQASRLKSEFLANTSHELRTPLNGIMGFLQLVLDGMCETPHEEREFLGQALQCSKHLLGLINDVLDIAKIEAGRLTFDIAAIDVQALFDDVYTMTHVQAQQKGLQLVFEPPPAGCPRVRGDFGKVKQILINLVGNSLKFTPAGGITVRAVSHQEAGHVLFEVADTGIGIPVERQASIFEKFTQADGSTTRRYGGTGLGLAISQSLVELLGGVIGAESQGAGQGTRISFSLPVWRGEEQESTAGEPGDIPSPVAITGPTGGPLILVVEDDPVFRSFVTTLLQQSGYRTVEASHAEAGWMLARKLRPSLVLLDYALACPEGADLRTGWDLAERMAADARTRNIPFVFVTGFERQLREKLKNVTYIQQPRHLPKPVEGGQLLAVVEETLGDLHQGVVRVLLADDDPTVVAFVGKVLGEERFQLDVVNNGEECLHLLRTHPQAFDLLLLDLMMPDVSGYDVLREMALSGTAAKLPVIVLTNFPEVRNEEERRLLEQGMVLDILAKTHVHEKPDLLPQAIDQHVRATRVGARARAASVERAEPMRPQVVLADSSTVADERDERFEHATAHASEPERGATLDDSGDNKRRAA